ncbi:hypothetical protein ES705_38210 [subsurface metagenome]
MANIISASPTQTQAVNLPPSKIPPGGLGAPGTRGDAGEDAGSGRGRGDGPGPAYTGVYDRIHGGKPLAFPAAPGTLTLSQRPDANVASPRCGCPPKASGLYLKRESSCANVVKTAVRGHVKGQPCGCPWCKKCAWRTPAKIISHLKDFRAGDGTQWAMITLTANRENYFGPMDCYRDWNERRALAHFVREGRRRGLFGERAFAWVEFQGGLWPHYHLCVELTPEFAASLARAYRRERGRGIIEINNSVVEPLWGRGFTCTTYGAGPVRAALYAAAYSVSGGKESQQGLPTWYDTWCRVTGKKRMHKWSFSRGFFDKENAVAKTSPKPPVRRSERASRLQRPTRAILAGCGVRHALFFLDVETTLIDNDTGEILKEGWYRVPIGRIEGNVEDVAGILRSNGVQVYAEDAGGYSLWPDTLFAVRRLIRGNWFGWHEVKAFGLDVQNVST